MYLKDVLYVKSCYQGIQTTLIKELLPAMGSLVTAKNVSATGSNPVAFSADKMKI